MFIAVFLHCWGLDGGLDFISEMCIALVPPFSLFIWDTVSVSCLGRPHIYEPPPASQPPKWMEL